MAECLGQGRHLDRIAQIGTGTVAFDVINASRFHACDIQRPGDRSGLTIDTGRQIAGLVATVVVDRTATDHAPDVIAVGDCIAQPPQSNRARTAAEHRTLRAVVESVAMPVRRQDLVILEQISAPLRQFDGHAAGQRHVAIALAQRLAGGVDRDQRG